jgi:anthranilate/para-aminobenzoate synthase component I
VTVASTGWYHSRDKAEDSTRAGSLNDERDGAEHLRFIDLSCEDIVMSVQM